VLQASAEAGNPIFLPEPNPIGTQEEREATQKELDMLLDLVKLDLMMEVTEKHKESIDAFIERMGFGLRFFMVSTDGYALFKRENLVVN